MVKGAEPIVIVVAIVGDLYLYLHIDGIGMHVGGDLHVGGIGIGIGDQVVAHFRGGRGGGGNGRQATMLTNLP